MKFQIPAYKSAFSLIELLIVSVIIGLFSGFMIANYQTFPEQKKLDSDVQKVVNVLELAKKKTLAADLSPGCSGNYLGYRVTIAPSDYRLYIRCSTVFLVQSYSYSSTSLSAKGSTTVDFKPLNAGVTQTGSPITIKHQGMRKCLDITISQVGLISISQAYTSGC